MSDNGKDESRRGLWDAGLVSTDKSFLCLNLEKKRKHEVLHQLQILCDGLNKVILNLTEICHKCQMEVESHARGCQFWDSSKKKVMYFILLITFLK